MTARKLVLRREPLAVLAPGDLRAVAGGASSPSCVTCFETRCFVMPEPAFSAVPTCQQTMCLPCPTD